MDTTRDQLLAEIAELRGDLAAARREAQRAAGRELLASEEVNRSIMEALPGGIVHVASDGSIVAANAEALAILGLSYDALTKRYTQDFEPETLREDGSPCPASDYPVSRALATGERQGPLTIGVRRPGGELSWAVFTAVPVREPSSGAVSGAIVTFIDITQRRRAECALRQSEARLRSILASAPNVIGAVDRAGKVLFINRSITGRDPREIEGVSAAAFLAPEDGDALHAVLGRVLATGEVASLEANGASGRRYSTRLGPITNEGEIVGATFVTWDITELRSLEARVTIADRMASIGTLAAGVAHEINNPLTYLLASLARIGRDAASGRCDEGTRAAVAAALEGCERIRSIVSDLSSFSHVGEAGRTPMDVRPLLDSSIRMAQSQTRYRARVVTQYGTVPHVVAADSRLGQVFLNLIVNAAQAIPEGNADEHQITVATSTDDAGRVVVEVTDTGDGIRPDLLDRVFDPFVTTKPPGVGTGLGLYIARNIVTSLDGEICVQSSAKGGTTFRVMLPANEGMSTASYPSSTTLRAAAKLLKSEALRVLVIDDEPAIGRVIEGALEGHDVTVARSGRAGLACLAGAEFDLVLCDLMMSDLTGMDVYDQVRAERAWLASRMVFMTGGAFTERARRFLESSSATVLEKPFGIEEVMAVAAKSIASMRAR